MVKFWPFPRNVKELRAFIGFAGFSRNFYEKFADLIQPLTNCLRKGAKLERIEQTLNVCQRVKDIMSSPPVLELCRPEAVHVVECDASNVATESGLKEVGPDGQERIAAYSPKMLSNVQRRWHTTRKDLLAVIHALTRRRHYLIGVKVIVKTDHNCLRYLKLRCRRSRYREVKNLTDQLARYFDGSPV